MSDSPGLVDFSIGLVNSVFNFPMGKCCFRIHSKSILLVKKLLGLVEMMTGSVNARFSLPVRQAVKVISIAPCEGNRRSGREGVVSYTALFLSSHCKKTEQTQLCKRLGRKLNICEFVTTTFAT